MANSLIELLDADGGANSWHVLGNCLFQERVGALFCHVVFGDVELVVLLPAEGGDAAGCSQHGEVDEFTQQTSMASNRHLALVIPQDLDFDWRKIHGVVEGDGNRDSVVLGSCLSVPVSPKVVKSSVILHQVVPGQLVFVVFLEAGDRRGARADQALHGPFGRGMVAVRFHRFQKLLVGPVLWIDLVDYETGERVLGGFLEVCVPDRLHRARQRTGGEGSGVACGWGESQRSHRLCIADVWGSVRGDSGRSARGGREGTRRRGARGAVGRGGVACQVEGQAFALGGEVSVCRQVVFAELFIDRFGAHGRDSGEHVGTFGGDRLLSVDADISEFFLAEEFRSAVTLASKFRSRRGGRPSTGWRLGRRKWVFGATGGRSELLVWSMGEVIEWDISPVVVHDSANQQSRLEAVVRSIQAGLRTHCTLSGDKSSRDTGEQCPAEHCAMLGCRYQRERREDSSTPSIEEHLHECHSAVFSAARRHLQPDDLLVCPRSLDMYHEAIRRQEQQKIPTVGCTIDRRVHRVFSELWNDDVQALVCFCCARVLIKESCGGCLGEVKMTRVFESNRFAGRTGWVDISSCRFLGMTAKETERTLGVATYLDDHGNGVDRPNLHNSPARDELDGWLLEIPFDGATVGIVCCPEDRQCNECNVDDMRVICGQCELPLCNSCEANLSKKKQPAIALANDLWVGFTPDVVFTRDVTYMEMLCASLVQPVMLNVVYTTFLERGNDMRHEVVQSGKVGGQPGKFGAKGNITGFMMPFERVVAELVKAAESSPEERAASLPRSGAQLSEVVLVTLMYMGDAPDPRILSKSTVRRGVVVELIEAMVSRGHRNYAHLDMQLVAEKAKRELVPQAGDFEPAIPPEVAVVFEGQNFQHESGKAAAPDDPPRPGTRDPLQFCSRGAVFDTSIMGEENTRDGCAYMSTLHNMANRTAGGEDLADTAGGDSSDVRPGACDGETWDLLTGKAISQLDATFMASAYAFLFPYSIGCPDLKHQVRDRKAGSPVVDFVDDWSRLMLQRVEGQFRRDLTFLFAVWNLIFRTMVNIGSNLRQVESRCDDPKIGAGDFKDAALAILGALDSKYESLDGETTSW